MTRWLAMAMLAMMVCGCAGARSAQTLGYDDLPNPPIQLVHVLKGGETGMADASGTHGVVDIHLSESDPIYEIWNDPQTRQDPWGTILLERVDPDGTVVARVREKELRAKAGEPFPETGIVVVQADPTMQSVVLRSKWTLTETREPPK